MPPRKPNAKQVPVSSLKHKDKRTNIPTRELQNFVKDEEKSPKTVSYPGLLYARDPSLDPQLVGKGKDEQDRHPPHAGVDGREALTRLHGDERQHGRGDTRGEQQQPTTHGRILLRIGQIDQCGH